jgi:hypothetical protein
VKITIDITILIDYISIVSELIKNKEIKMKLSNKECCEAICANNGDCTEIDCTNKYNCPFSGYECFSFCSDKKAKSAAIKWLIENLQSEKN